MMMVMVAMLVMVEATLVLPLHSSSFLMVMPPSLLALLAVLFD